MIGLTEEVEAPPAEPEDLEAAMSYIDSLPIKKIRGLSFPSDERSYFVRWPDGSFYKRRFFDPGSAKYIGAKGHKKPWFFASYVEGADTCVLVEGEINALSIAKACPEFTVISPGGCGDFSSKNARKISLHSTILYSTILIIADRDAPGAEACIEMMSLLQGSGKRVVAHLMSPDANEVLIEQGETAVQREVKRALGRGLENGSD